MLTENKTLQSEIDELKRNLQINLARENVLGRQIRSLEEDNERLAKMYA